MKEEEIVLKVQMAGCGKNWAFVELANEVLASTAVTIGNFRTRGGGLMRLGWPSGRVEKDQAPSLVAVCDRGHDSDDGLQQSNDDDEFAEVTACEVHLDYVRDLDAESIWNALTEFFHSLPAYVAAYGRDEPGPVVNLRVGNNSFAFVRLTDPVLASTAVACGTLWVRGRRIAMSRGSKYVHPLGGEVPPLEIAPPPSHLPKGPRFSQKALSDKPHCFPPLPPPPPPPRSQPGAGDCKRLWIGNLMPVGNPSELTHLLDNHLTSLALAADDGEFEQGPPVKQVSVHHSGRFAFAELRDSALAQRLKPKFDGSDFCGAPLVVDWAVKNRSRYGRFETESETLMAGGSVNDDKGPSVSVGLASQDAKNEVKHDLERRVSGDAIQKKEPHDANSSVDGSWSTEDDVDLADTKIQLPAPTAHVADISSCNKSAI